MSEESSALVRDNVVVAPFGQFMRQQFGIYAEDVVKNRAVPDVYTGLKPVQARILQSMRDLGLQPNVAYKKSAKTVGACLGSYHPHGDTSVYDALVNMAQDFNMRYPLIDLHGNGGSIDGDPAAAMRYTEAKLSPMGALMLRDINKNTVNMVPNYDASEMEAERLPGLFPSLICNGASGIAVGMASSFLPHCAKDVYACLDMILENALKGEDTSIDAIISKLKAPDFPTGGVIVGMNGVQRGYREGKGTMKVRCKYEIVQEKNHDEIRISEIPYKVNKANMVQQIAEAKKTYELDIREIHDYSAKGVIDVRIVLGAGANTQVIVKQLLKHTDMQTSLSMNHVALVDGRPQQNLTIRALLYYFLSHCMEVVKRRTQFDLDAAEKRMHLLGAIADILESKEKTDEAIEIIRSAAGKADAISKLIERFEFDEEQATYVGNQKLWTLNADTMKEIFANRKALQEEIDGYNTILESDESLMTEVRVELAEIANKFKDDERRTEIGEAEDETIDARDYVEKRDIIVTYTHNGLIKAVELTDCSTQKRNGRGNNLKLKEDDFVRDVVTVNTHDDLLVVTNIGKGYILPAFKIPVVKKTSVGKYVNNYVAMSAEESIVNILPVREADKDHDILFVTKQGVAKRVSLDDLPAVSNGAKMINIRENDELVVCTLVHEDDKLLVCTAEGLALKTPVSNVRVMGRAAAGNILMRFKTDTDYIVSAMNVKDGDTVFVITEMGLGKRLNVDAIAERANKGGKGVIYYKPNNKSGNVVNVLSVKEDQTIIVVTQKNVVIRTEADSISEQSRTSHGVAIIKMKDDMVLSASTAPKDAEQESDDNDAVE